MKNFLKREFLLKRIGGRVSGEVKTDEGKTSPLISVKQLPRSPSVNLSISFSLFYQNYKSRLSKNDKSGPTAPLNSEKCDWPSFQVGRN